MEDLQTFSAQLSMVEATCRAHAELTASALYDALTALPNRAHFVRRLDAAVNAATGSEHQVGLLLIDLDDFKDVNDTFGHAAGDQVLTEVARRMTRIVGDRCLPARLGGDEFAVLVSDAQDLGMLDRLAERLRDGLVEPIPWHGVMLQVGASIGLVERVIIRPP